MYDPVVITLLEKNVKELQGQLVNANKRIKALTDENYNLRRELGVQKNGGRQVTNNSGGVWLGDAEMPDAEHLKDEK
jgi:hypothetical protein|tara:strand:+ start:86 stop:316 length:231 start_codon:yes stop_codon:yes gene_type:complete